jgi:hypothetical protein
VYIVNSFVDSFLFHTVNVQEVPNFFTNRVKGILQSLIIPGEEGKEQTTAKRFTADQLLATLALHRLYVGPLQVNESQKVLEFVKERKLSGQVFMN